MCVSEMFNNNARMVQLMCEHVHALICAFNLHAYANVCTLASEHLSVRVCSLSVCVWQKITFK